LESGRDLVFFDASVLFAAAHSPTGGSAAAMEVCRGLRFRAAVTTLVLAEARVNIAEKLDDSDLVRFYRQLADLSPVVLPPPSQTRLKECVPLTTEKDAHVLAAALDGGAAILLTLDRRHLLTRKVLDSGLPVEVVTPGDFLRGLASEAPEGDRKR
jgi:predicted nucleic acid-binding protein